MKKVAIGLAEPPEPPPPSKAARRRNSIAEWCVTLLILLFATAMVAQPFVVPTGSMENTVLIGDHILADKMSYGPAGPVSRHLLPYTDVKRGDVIIFQYPLDLQKNYVKRVIGVPGDRIRVEAKQLYLNGRAVQEPYKVHKSEQVVPYRDYFPAAPLPGLPPSAVAMLENHVVNGELIVPPGNYFAMGDNRDNSEDSRFWGFVPRANIVAKPVLIYWSYDAPTADLADGGFGVDHLIDLGLHFFTKTRWDRTFQLVRGYPLQ